MRQRQSLATISASSPTIKSPTTETPRNKGPEIIQNEKDLLFDLDFLQPAAIVWGAGEFPGNQNSAHRASWAHSSA